MCGLCGLGDAGAVVGGASGNGHAAIWPGNAATLLAHQGLTIADGAALFGGAATGLGSGPAAAAPAGDAGALAGADPTGFTALFDIPSGTGTPVSLGSGQRMTAEISVPGDTDWFRMSLTQGQQYEISLKALPFFGLADPQIYLFDNNGTFLVADDNSGTGLNSVLTVTATRTGIYYAGATGFGGGGQTTGQYEISLSPINAAADTVGATTSTAGSVAVGSQVLGTIDFGTDEDWYAVTVQKGQTYAVFLDAYLGTFTPLANPFLEVADRNLTTVALNDDNGVTLNSALTFTADYNGKYYIKAKGGPGNTGDFQLTVANFSPPAPASPLKGIDWGAGTEFNKTNITYYFAKQGETFANETTDSPWNAYQMQQAAAALAEFSRFSPLTFTEVSTAASADFVLTKNFADTSTTGRMFPQDPAFGTNQGVGWFNTDPDVWSLAAGGFLEKGAFGYSNFMHEFGHGLSLAHPHDNGGGTSAVFAGVTKSSDVGDDQLNQEVFTIMSYNKGWQTGFNGSSGTNAYGMARTPMAFDIALIQEKYGTNTNHNGVNNTYTLWTANGTGTGYEAIWDTGGKDTIVNPGSAGATIDLRQATLKQEPGGGGFVSAVLGVHGGYTIANGVRIENATGGSGNDTLIGNGLKNVLNGGAGKDIMLGGKGNDRYILSEATDVVSEKAKGGTDTVVTSAFSLKLKDYQQVENAKLTGSGNLDASGSKKDNVLVGNKGQNSLNGGNGDDTLKGGGGNDALNGGRGKDVLKGGGGSDSLKGGGGDDRIEGGGGNDTLTGGGNLDDFIFKKNFGADTITDFAKGTDELHLSKKLWSGDLGVKQVVNKFADVVGGEVVFDFGGHRITLDGVGSVNKLSDDLVLF
ncbi:hypothetical protein CVM52_23520 [Pseudooceanicola lipolyticus]|uniref:Peptidase metallopeptidase domain-containing protein n=1 Tax=Pseudooceanicola lipolyticus TaxID=2029104 RepID=A0A2M8IUJ7_9RHOB|nr:pre-peptidase C-terminal domain-containing protein [Pseudooceanicola lipolyticus]PJE34197.1 hypothetical protein CVM52_23520 [Pseudooceanicola lipolyticus]